MVLRKNKLLTKYLSLGWISCIGDALFYLALMTYAATTENPALGILIITISTTFPNIIEIILGALADSTKQKTLRIIQSGIFRGIVFIIIAIIINQTNSLAGIISIGILNALSDTIGSFSALVKSPFLRLIAKEDQLEEAIGINQGVRQTIDVIAGFLGVLLLGFLGVYYLAFFNAAIFFIVSFGFKLLKRNLSAVEAKLDPPEINGSKDLLNHIKSSVLALLQIKPLRNFLLIAAALNGILSAAVPVILMSIAETPSAQIMNFEFTVSIAKGIIFIFGLAAALLGAKYCKGIGTTFILIVEILVVIGFMFSVVLIQPWIAIGFLSIGVFFTTMFSIRLSTFFQQAVPAETLGTVGAAIGLFLSVLPIPLTLLLSSIAAISFTTYSVVGTVFSIIALILVLFMKLDKIDLKSAMTNYGKQA